MSEKSPTGHFGNRSEEVHFPTDPAQLSHIFGTREGHLPDTPANRQLLLELANDSEHYLGKDEEIGLDWHARIDSDGTQLWVSSWREVIQNGGRNDPPRNWNSTSGLNNEALQ